MSRVKKIRIKETGDELYVYQRDGGYYGAGQLNASRSMLNWYVREEFDYLIEALDREGKTIDVLVDYNKHTHYLCRGDDGVYLFLKKTSGKFPNGMTVAWVRHEDLDIYKLE